MIKNNINLGYNLQKNFLSTLELENLIEASDWLLSSNFCDKSNIRSRFQLDAKDIPERFDPIVDTHVAFKNLTNHPELIKLVQNKINDVPILFKDKLIIKSAGVKGYEMHQDYSWWEDFCDDGSKMISVMIALDDMNEHNGCLEIYPSMPLVASKRNWKIDEISKLNSEGLKMPLKAGDILIFDGLCPHCSGDNYSNSSRRAIYLTYSPQANGDKRKDYYKYYVERERSDNTQLDFW